MGGHVLRRREKRNARKFVAEKSEAKKDLEYLHIDGKLTWTLKMQN